MALTATVVFEVQSGGADDNGGGFDTRTTSKPTNLAATGATSSTPVCTSATYNFIARDVNHWLFVPTGTNWNPGWYKILSVASNAATIDAAAGNWCDFTTYAPGTLTGCATVASPTGGTWAVDYSQSTSAGISFTDLVIASTTTFTSAANPCGVNMVGNILSLNNAGASGATVQRYEINSVSGTTATVDKTFGVSSGSGISAKLGGAFGSPGMAGSVAIAGTDLSIKAGTYTITSATNNVTGGCVSWPTPSASTNIGKIVGYGTVRGDFGTRPLLQASGISTFSLVTLSATNQIINVAVDGASLTSSRGINGNGAAGTLALRCKASNCTNSGFGNGSVSAYAVLCEATGCGTVAAISGWNTYASVAHDNTFTGIATTAAGMATTRSASVNNTGGTSNGFDIGGSATHSDNIAYGNGQHGFVASSGALSTLVNCLGAGNTGYNFTASVATPTDGLLLINCAGYSTGSGNVDGTKILPSSLINFRTLLSSPFTNAGGNDFSPTSTSGLWGGAIPGPSGTFALPGLSTPSYPDQGGVQHTAAAAAAGAAFKYAAGRRTFG